MSNWTLEKEINNVPQNDLAEPVIRTAVDIIEKSKNILDDHLYDLDDIQELLDETFDVQAPTWTKKIWAYLLWQAINTVKAKMKPLDAQLRADWIDEEMRNIVSQWVAWVMKNWGYDKMLRDNFSGFDSQLTYWDFIWMVWTDNKWLPEFRKGSLQNIYFNPQATNLRSKDWTQATRCVIVYEYNWDEAIKIWPELETKWMIGKLPSTVDQEQYDDLQQKEDEQREYARKRLVEVWFYYDITSEARYTIFAWPTAAILEDKEWEEYPFYLGEWEMRDNYIPLLQWICFPTKEWIFNAWIWHIVYRLATLYREMWNKAANHMLDNMDPLRIINLPKQQAPWFLAKVKQAQEAQKKWKKPLVVNAFWEWEKQSWAGQLDTLQATPLTQEFERFEQFLITSLRRFGINLDTVFTQASKTATALQLEEEAQSEFIRQIQEQNTSTYEMAIKITIDMIKKNISSKDKTPLPIDITVTDEETWEVSIESVTLWMLADELKLHEYIPVVNSRSWVIFSRVIDKFYLQSAINDATALWDLELARSLTTQKHAINWIKFKSNAPAPQQPWWQAAPTEWWAPSPEQEQEQEILV